MRDFLKSFSTPDSERLFSTILELAKESDVRGLFIVVQGGYAVDLAYGEQTRVHDDIDLIGNEDQRRQLMEMFIDLGYIVHDPKTIDQNFYIEKDGIHIDVDLVRIDYQKNQVTDYDEPERYIWPVKARDLFRARVLGEVKVKYANPFLVKKFKELQIGFGKPKRDKEVHDFEILNTLIPK